MITFDQLRSALFASDPRVALDGLVHTEIATGRTTKAIYDELLDHVEAVRAMPEYTDAIEDVLGDTMDALSGWVHPDFAYKDSPEPTPLPIGEPSAAPQTPPTTSQKV